MPSIRVCTEQDIPAVVELFGRAYPAERWRSQTGCERYFRDVLFENPWRSLGLPSWVAEESGRLLGDLRFGPRAQPVAQHRQFVQRQVRQPVRLADFSTLS